MKLNAHCLCEHASSCLFLLSSKLFWESLFFLIFSMFKTTRFMTFRLERTWLHIYFYFKVSFISCFSTMEFKCVYIVFLDSKSSRYWPDGLDCSASARLLNGVFAEPALRSSDLRILWYSDYHAIQITPSPQQATLVTFFRGQGQSIQNRVLILSKIHCKSLIYYQSNFSRYILISPSNLSR